MFTKLSWKLTFFMVLVSALTIIFASVLTDRALDRQFGDFLELSQLERNQQMLQAIKDIYGETQDRITIERQLELLGQATDAQIIVRDARGERRMGHMAHMGQMGMVGGHMMRRQTTGDLVLPDGSMKEIEIIPALSPEYTLQEVEFRQAVNGSITIAAFLSLGASLLLSAFFSWGLTKPLTNLVTMVRKVGEGDLGQRTEVKGQDELKYLSEEFNQMAANLERMEQLRLKLTNDLAHEFRTPLATVQAYLEGINDGVLEPTSENLNLILEETLRLEALLGGLQELAKLEQPMAKKEQLDMEKLLTFLVAPLRILAEEKEISFQLNMEQTPLIKGDCKMLETALRNLVENAIKYTPPHGQVLVLLRAEPRDLVIEVSDTGIGIEAQDLPFIFERFYRTDLSRSRQTGGTGIGLAVTEGIIKAHGGTISVNSKPQVGSTFTVRLPMA